jgi:Ser/Thr protein kinase RdoA (MazF antagonist)
MPAALKALESFPVDPINVELVKISENITFRVTLSDDETDYVLRLHRPGYNSIEELISERLWVGALKEAGSVVQDSLLTREGNQFELIDIPGTNEQRYAGMTTWLGGTPLSDFLETSSGKAQRARLFRCIGEIAATIHNQSTGWSEPEGFTRRHLNLEGLLGDAPFWGRFWEHADLTIAEANLLLRTRDRCSASLSAYGETPETFSLIHADLHADNIIYNSDEPGLIDLGLIDFDDSVYGWHMYDIASALIEETTAQDREVIQAALLDGYRDNRSLARRDEDMLPDFLLIRGMAIIGWYHQRPEHFGSTYFEAVKNWVIGECETRER